MKMKIIEIFEYIPTADGANMANTQAVQNLVKDTKEKYTKKNIKNYKKKNLLLMMKSKM